MNRNVLKERFVPLLDECSDSLLVINKLNQITAQGDLTSDARARAIESDEILAQQFLRVVNSALYAEFPGKAETVTQAISLLGLTMTEEFVTSIAVFNSIHLLSGKGIFDFHSFCGRAVFCGTAARNLAKCSYYHAPEEAFVAGLIHDSGKAFILASISEGSTRRRELANPGLDGLQAERDTFGFDHCDVGQFIAEYWKLSPKIRAILSDHHRDGLGVDERCDAQIIDLIYIACRIFEERTKNDPHKDTMLSLQEETEQLLDISPSDLSAVIDESVSMSVQMADCIDLKCRFGEKIV